MLYFGYKANAHQAALCHNRIDFYNSECFYIGYHASETVYRYLELQKEIVWRMPLLALKIIIYFRLGWL